MKKTEPLYFASCVALMMVLGGCYTINKVSVQNISSQYRSDLHYLHPEYTLYSVNDSISLLYYKIDESNLLYVRRNQADSFSATVRIYCRLTPSYDESVVEDTNAVTLHFSSITNTKMEISVGTIPLRIKAGRSHVLSVITLDEVSKKIEETYIEADKTTASCAQDFMLRDPNTGYIIFSNYIDTPSVCNVMYNRVATKLYVSYYKRDFPTALPPFSTVEPKQFIYKPDSSFAITVGENGMAPLSLKGEGFYHVMADTNSRMGLTIYRYPKSFPGVGYAYQLVKPLRYITTNEEYDKVIKSNNVKQAVDAFWINTAGNTQERARALIRNYYTRVGDANKYFSSYEEGWKTDRGMIYIVYGPPSSIFRSEGSEIWTYGEDKNYMTLSFTFVKINNPFSDNDYLLQRQPQFKNLWYNAVDVWREGRAY